MSYMKSITTRRRRSIVPDRELSQGRSNRQKVDRIRPASEETPRVNVVLRAEGSKMRYGSHAFRDIARRMIFA